MKLLASALAMAMATEALDLSVRHHQMEDRLLSRHRRDIDPDDLAAGITTDEEDTKFLPWQEEILFGDPSKQRSRNKAAALWHNYIWGDKYVIPIMVNSNSYPQSYWPTLWESLRWAEKHYVDRKTFIDVQYIDKWDVAEGDFNKGYIHAYNGNGCWSYMGTHKVEQAMSLGWCYKVPGSIVHEIMHALGWVHEHMRPDRGDYLNVRGRGGNCRAMNAGALDDAGTGYDIWSIMQYPVGTCGITVRRDCTECRNPPKGLKIGQRVKLTDTDVFEINTAYPKLS